MITTTTSTTYDDNNGNNNTENLNNLNTTTTTTNYISNNDYSENYITCVAMFNSFPCWWRILSSADNLCKHFGSRSGPTKRRA